MDVGFWMGLALGLIAGMVGCAVVHAVAADHWRNAGRKLWWSDRFADMADRAIEQGREVVFRINKDTDGDD